MRGAGFHMETLENYKLGSMKMTTQNDLYYCQNGLGAESRSGQEIRKFSKKMDIYAILGMVLSQNRILNP